MIAWQEAGLLDETTKRKLLRYEPPPNGEKKRSAPPAIEERADAIYGSAASFFGEMTTNMRRIRERIEAEAPPPSSSQDLHRDVVAGEEAADAGRALFGGRSAVVGAGLHALGELDEDDAPRAPMSAGLQVFWFIGAILVLAGSLMGVREAWRSLEGAFRPLAIAGALFAYHVAFAGLARLLARRSEVTGRVLGVIAIGLLPVAFVAIAVAYGMGHSAGIASAAVMLAASCATLTWASRVFDRTAALGLVLGLVPCLALEVPLGDSNAETTRLLVPLAALLPLFVASVTNRGIAFLAAATYGAIVVALFALFGGPSDPALDLGSYARPALAAVLWMSCTALVVWNGSDRLPRAGPVVRIVMLAVLVGTALAGVQSGAGASREGLLAPGWFAYTPALACAFATFALAMEQRRQVHAIWLAVPLAHLAIYVAAFTFTGLPAASFGATALAPAVLLLVASSAKSRAHRIIVPVVATASSFFVVVATWASELFIPQTTPLVITATAAAVLCGAAHLGARTVRPVLHYLGAAMALAAALAYFGPSRPEPGPLVVVTIVIGLAAVYGIAALPYGLLAREDGMRPLDDVSLLLATFATYGGWLYYDLPLLRPSRVDDGLVIAFDSSTFGVAAAVVIVLALRAARDRSRLVTLHAGIAVATLIQSLMGSVGTDTGMTALALALPALFRAPTEPVVGRPLFGIVPLPLGARGRLLLDGFAFASIVFAVIMCLRASAWIGAGSHADLIARELLVLGLACVIVTALVAFSTHAFDNVFARGNVTTLAVGGMVIAIEAVTYRIGRPLPPDVVGWRITLVLFGVWLLAQLLVRKGPWLGEKLGRPSHGTLYHYVPHAGVGGLSLLLFVDAVLVGSPTATRFLALVPPMLLFGAALGAFLLWRSFRHVAFVHVTLALLFAFAWLVGAQRHVLGPALLPLDPPGGRWLPAIAHAGARVGSWIDPRVFLPGWDTELAVWGRAFMGGAIASLSYAAAFVGVTRARRDADLAGAFLVWTCIGAAFIAFALAMQPAVLLSVVLLAAALVALAARGSAVKALPLVLAAPLVVHALAHEGEVLVPEWPGPALALETFVVVAGGAAVTRRMAERDPRVLVASQLLGAVYGAFAIAYASAVYGIESKDVALPTIFTLAQRDDNYAQSFALAVTLVILAITTAVAAWSWRGAIARIASIAPPIVLAWAAFAFSAAFVFPQPGGVLPRLVTRDGPLLGAILAMAAAIAHVASIGLARRGHVAASEGTRFGRDGVLAAAALTMVAYVLANEPGGFFPGMLGLIALGLQVAVGVDAIVREGSKRHVYFVELLVVALYAFATDNMSLRPEVDAMLGLAYGFTLLGVAVLARRRKLVDVADATRKSLAVLPLVVAVLTMRGATDAAAGFAIGASLLYGAAAFTEKSRAFGSLAAIAANAALIVFALAQGLDGIEIWLGPLGLLVAAIAQIFASRLSPSARSAVRIIGGVLLYLPSGFKLALRLGAAEDATYSVVFGVVCLLGVLAGVVLRVRAYLALGTLALTLDIVANLVHAGLRDHRLGFVILSVSGLAIIGVMIFLTLRRDRAWAIVGRVRTRLRGWE